MVDKTKIAIYYNGVARVCETKTNEHTTFGKKGDSHHNMKNRKYDFDYSKLSGRIVEIFGNRSKFAEHFGKPCSYVSNLLGGKVLFSQDTIILWADSLQIGNDEIADYFLEERFANR